MALENLTIDVKFKINSKPLDNLNKKLDKIPTQATKGFSKVEQSINKVASSGNKITKALQKPMQAVQKVTDKVNAKIKNVRTSIDKTVAKSKTLSTMKRWFDRIGTSADNLRKKIFNVGTATQNASSKGSKGFGSITGSVFKGNLALQAFNMGLQAIKNSISGIIQLSDKWTNTTARLNLLTGGDATKTSQLKDSIFKAAQNSRGDFGATADTVAKLGLLAGDSFKDNNELVRFTELLNKQFAIAGADETQKEAGLLQLSQAMASGKLQGDEFRSIMENAPLLADAIAKYTGKSKGELKEMSSEGLITSDIIKKALFKAGEGENGIDAMFEKMPMTFSSAMTKIKNEATYSLQGLMTKVNNVLNSDFGRGAVQGITNAIKGFISGVEIAIQKVGEFGTWISEKISPHAGTFKSAFTSIKDSIVSLWTQIQPILVEWGAKFANIYERVIPLAARLWNEVLAPFVDWVVNYLWPVLQPIIKAIGDATLQVIDGILAAIDGITTALSGVIDFLKGVFTGDWELAWEGVKKIFSGIWDGIKGILKGAINGIITLINGFFGGMNIKIPDWIPADWGGGKTFSLPQIPLLAKGSNDTPDTFIAGEQGPELVTNAPHRKVYTANETQDILGGGNGAVYNNTFTFNITSNNPDEFAKKVKSTIEEVFGSINRRNPRLREI